MHSDVVGHTQGATSPRENRDAEDESNPIHSLPPELLAQIFLFLSPFRIDNRNYCPPLVVSHVCQKWRSIALSTPTLWSWVSVNGYKNPLPSLQFFTRSGVASLDIEYRSPCGILPSDESGELAAFLADSRQVLPRVEMFSVRTEAMRPLVYLRQVLDQHTQTLPNLRHLSIAIATPHPSCSESPQLMPPVMPSGTEATAAVSSARLKSLRLEQFPPFNLSRSLVANLKTLELAFSPRKKYGGAWDYFLKMADLCRLLSATPRLEELILVNTVPYFDVSVPSVDCIPTSPRTPTRIDPVRLHHLKSIDWSFPFPYDIYRFFSMLDTPVLEKLDIWIDDFPKRVDTSFLRGYALNTTTKHYSEILSYLYVRELNIHCVSDDFYGLRKFFFSSLESLVLNNVSNLTANSPSRLPKLLQLPRLESIFRDPRLFNLTRLSISAFRIPSEDDRIESVLNYLPALTSLSLEHCVGVQKLLAVLAETVVLKLSFRPSPSDGPEIHRHPATRGVKVCPHLEAMSFWSCPDVNFATLRDVLVARRDCRENAGGVVPPAHQPSSDRPSTSTDDARIGDSAAATTTTSEFNTTSTATPEIPTPSPSEEKLARKIKPLRRPRRQPQAQQQTSLLPSSSPPTDSHMLDLTQRLSSLLSVGDISRPSSIIYLRIASCPVREVEARALAELGALEVVWVGGDDESSTPVVNSNEQLVAPSHV